MELVGLASDTHVPSRAHGLPRSVLDVFNEVSIIIHAGDLDLLKVIEDLEMIAPVVAVHGNADQEEVRARYPKVNSIRLFNWRIGVTHDAGALWGKRGMREIAEENRFDVLFFGHTHRPFLRKESIIFINPGSPTDPFPPWLVKPSVGLLRVERERIVPSIVGL